MNDEQLKIKRLYLFEHKPSGRLLVDRQFGLGTTELSLQSYNKIKSDEWSLVYAFENEHAERWLMWLKTEGKFKSSVQTMLIDGELTDIRVIELITTIQ